MRPAVASVASVAVASAVEAAAEPRDAGAMAMGEIPMKLPRNDGENHGNILGTDGKSWEYPEKI